MEHLNSLMLCTKQRSLWCSAVCLWNINAHCVFSSWMLCAQTFALNSYHIQATLKANSDYSLVKERNNNVSLSDHRRSDPAVSSASAHLSVTWRRVDPNTLAHTNTHMSTYLCTPVFVRVCVLYVAGVFSDKRRCRKTPHNNKNNNNFNTFYLHC